MNTNIYYSDKIPNSNFDGDWDAECSYCKRQHREHLFEGHPDPDYMHRMPCEEQKAAMTKEFKRSVQTIQVIVFIGWILIPLLIAILGFASTIIGAILLAIALFKIAVEGVKLYGNPEKLIPGHKEKAEKKRKMDHYYYHCERNPEGFIRLKLENFDDE